MYIAGSGFSLLAVLFSSTVNGQVCVDPLDNYHNYDNFVSSKEINNQSSDHYVMRYSWAGNYCAKVSSKHKQPGEKDYLQCHSGSQFGYILHGLWPQGRFSSSRGYPRACRGDQPKIPRAVLEPYLCMTPSVWLLQHEYEYHGTCMPAGRKQSPEGYLSTAFELHQRLSLPRQQLYGNKRGYTWWYVNNPHLVAGSVSYIEHSKEWQLCLDRNFKSMACKRAKNLSTRALDKTLKKFEKKSLPRDKCLIKGNISKKNGNKLYFLRHHSQYAAVRIDHRAGERCFNTESQARAAGWIKAK